MSLTRWGNEPAGSGLPFEPPKDDIDPKWQPPKEQVKRDEETREMVPDMFPDLERLSEIGAAQRAAVSEAMGRIPGAVWEEMGTRDGVMKKIEGADFSIIPVDKTPSLPEDWRNNF